MTARAGSVAQLFRNVAGNDKQRDSAGVRLSDRRERVGGAGAAGDQRDAKAAASTRQSVRGVHRGLFVTHTQNSNSRLMAIMCVEGPPEGQVVYARKSKRDLHADPGQGVQDLVRRCGAWQPSAARGAGVCWHPRIVAQHAADNTWQGEHHGYQIREGESG